MDIEKELRLEIKSQLEKVTEANSPELFSRLQTPEGYAGIEDVIINQVVATGVTPAALIPQLETEYSMM